ncbi:pectate lyase-like adhesive domain-containing protein [Paenilisteria weihenstephanensis]|uniref:pectate lyase-like adhesive domain-containing protein n=1 Tax=Listeria weihenstephanensis TaxID=1006155 RepID=UPI0004AD0433|nr:pectate lyase-like adhesive domain-containing protein [Listeria weihenstephanensis]
MMKLLRRTMAVTLVCSFVVASVAPVMSSAETSVETTSEIKTESKADETTPETPEKKVVKGSRLQATANVANVTDYLQLEAAMKDVTITEINIMNDINFSNYTTGSAAESNLSIPTRSITINGNGNTVDFRSRGYLMSFGSNKVDIVIKDIKMFGRNYWGPLRLSGTAGKGTQLTYQNIEYTGAQLTCSYEADVNIIGHVTNSSVNSYVSPFDGVTYAALTNQVNLEITNINFYENSIYTGSTTNATVINLGNGGTATVGKNAEVYLLRGGSAGEEGTCTFKIDGNLNINDGAFVQIRTEPGSTAGGIKLNSSGSSLHISENAELMVNTLGATSDTRNPIYIASGASLKVDSGAKLNIRAESTGTSTGAAIYTGDNSSFIVAKDGTFDVQTDGTGSKYLIRIGNASTFQFADAKRVNLQLNNTNTGSRLIYMYGTSGKLNVDVQSVKAWTGTDWRDDGNETYLWNPMYGMNIKFSSSNVSSVTANSVNEATQSSFIQNFRTQNFRRVLFEGIPDVSVSINTLTDDKTAENSHVITGVTNPGAYVKLTGDPAIPVGTIASQDFNDANMYHAIADATGKYSFILPAGSYVSAGNQVTAYSYLNGKSATASTIVKDVVAPDAPTLNAISDKATTVTGDAEANATVTVYKKADNTILATGKADGSGHYSITIPVSERPITPYIACYAVATDAASNTSEHSADVIVTDTTKPTATAVTQYATVGDTFTTNAKSLVTDVYDNAGTSDDNLTYTIDTQPDLSKVGYTTAQTTICDRAGNTMTVIVPIFVKDAGTVSDEQTMLQATDITIQVAEYPDNEAELNTLIKTRSGVKAWAIPSGADITSQVTLDKMGLPNTPGKYNVSFSVNGLEKRIEVTVQDGSLSLGTATENISFGEQMITSKAKTVKPIDDVQLFVSDTRGEPSNWRVNAQLESPLQTADGKVLEDVLAIQTTEGETSLSTENAIPVYSNDALQRGLTEINLNSNEASLVMNVKPGTAMANKEYRTNVRWTLEDAP